MPSLRDLFGTIALKAGQGLSDLKTFNEGLDKSQEELDKTEKKTKKLGQRMVSMGRNAAKAGKAVAKGLAVGTGAVLAGTVALFAFASAWATSADEIGKSSIQLRIGSDALQELRFASKLAGAETSTLNKVLRDLSNKSAEAKLTGTGPFADALKAMNVELESFTKLPIDKQLEFLSDELNKIGDTTLRTGLSMRLFGRGAINLGVLIDSGSKGIQAGRKELREFGLVMSPEMLDRAALLADTIARTTALFDAFKNMIGAKVAPAVTKYLVRFNKLLLANKDLIGQKIERVFEVFVKFLEQGIPLLADTVLLVSDFVDTVGGLDSVIRTAAEAWAVFQLAGLAVMGPGGALAAAIGLTALGIARVDRELKRQKKEALERDTRLRNPDDPLSGLSKGQIASEEAQALASAAFAARLATDRLKTERTRSSLIQAERNRVDEVFDEFAHEFETTSQEETEKSIEAADKRLKIAQTEAERLQNVALRERERFDLVQAELTRKQLAAQADIDQAQRDALLKQVSEDGAGGIAAGRKKAAAATGEDEPRALTPAEQLAAAFGGKVKIAGNPFERLGTGSTINQIDARVFVTVGGVSNSFQLPAGSTPEEVASVAQQTTAQTIRDHVEEAFSHHRNVFVT